VEENYFDVAHNDSECQHAEETNSLDEQLALMTSNPKQVSGNNNSLDIMLHDLLQKHKASLLLYDEISNLFNNYLASPTFDRFAKLKTRKALLMSMQKSMNTESLRPIDCVVQLHDHSLATVPVFNTKYMIMSLLSDQKLMNDQFFPDGYNIFTGDVDQSHPANESYGEVHTDDAWIPARNRYCVDASDMPVALILFADKSHTDLHGALSLTPIIFTLTLFNRIARNNPKFWRPMGYIPNLTYGKGTSDKTEARDKIQDEHKCITCILQSLKDISQSNGFEFTVLGRSVRVKVWIHFFIGDTEGNNKWLGQYPGNRCGVKRPYRDCKCPFNVMCHPNPNCTYITLDDINVGKRRKEEDNDGGTEYFRSISSYDIDNALLEKNIPLSDDVHGPYKMMPPELLHTSGSGLIMYMFESLRYLMGGGRDRDAIDQLHIEISNHLKRQSERDFPRGSMRNGLIDGTKCQSSERKGNLFRLLCIAHTARGSSILQKSLSYTGRKWNRLVEFLKLYLSMEEWFHDANKKEEVTIARVSIAKVLQMLQQLFPRPPKTNGYNIPKMHGMTKMQSYIKLFGSGINFYGGPGESAHKLFIKIPGQRTQRRVGELAKQTALQYYNMLVSSYAAEECRTTIETNQLDYYEKINDAIGAVEWKSIDDDVVINLSGKYEFVVTHDNIRNMEENSSLLVKWAWDDRKLKDQPKYVLSTDLVRMLLRKTRTVAIGKQVIGYTKLVITTSSGHTTSFYGHPCFLGKEWYDWALVHFEEVRQSGGS